MLKRFLWTTLQLHYLSRLRVLTDTSLVDTLDSLPSDLDATYSRLLTEIDGTLTQPTRRALIWLSFSARTLYVEELVEACAVDLDRGSCQILGPKGTPYLLYEMLHDMVSIQPPLPQRDTIPPHNTHIITLCHASVVEFLQKSGTSYCCENPRLGYFMIEKSSSDLLMARACLAYLFQYNTHGTRIENFPLLNYAWWHWEKHVNFQEGTPLGIDQGIFRREAIEIYSKLKLSRMKTKPTATSASSVQNEFSDPAQNFVRKYLDWMPTSGLDRFLESLHSPFFFPDYDCFIQRLDQCYSEYESLPLGPGGTQCRFLELLPCLDAETPVHCRLLRDDLRNQPRYIAMSYVWSNQLNDDIVFIDGKISWASPSQAQICKLLRSRKEGSTSRVWVDALCIDDSHGGAIFQISLICQIFKQAQEVLIILGAEPANARQGLALLERLATSTQQSQGAREPAIGWQRTNALEILQEL